MVGLQSGQIDCVYTPPVVAAAYQWFALAPNMTDFGVAPVIGGLVITQRTWSRIPEKYHEELRASMEKLARDFYSESVRLNNEALRVMADNGLVVSSTNPSRNSRMAGSYGGRSEPDDWRR
jgi:TRAP-type C4-dicarboxylate transport system substrate-binding protein